MFGLFRKTECEKIRGMLSEYIDKRLAAVQGERVEVHLRECQTCRIEFESLQFTVDLLHRVPLVPGPRSFIRAEMAPVRPDGIGVALNVLRGATAFAALALAIVLLGDVFSYYGGVAPLSKEAMPASAPSLAEVSDRQLLLSQEASGVPEEEGGVALEKAQAPKYAEDAAQTPVTGAPQPVLAQTPEVTATETPSQRATAIKEFGLYSWGGERILGPLREIHVALLGVVVVLGGITVLIGRQQRKRMVNRREKEA